MQRKSRMLWLINVAISTSLTLLLFSTSVYSSDFDELCMDQLPSKCWRTEDVIDERIEWHAQSALMTMFGRDGEDAAAASAILCAVKRGQLDGIYRHTMQVPSMRAQKAGTFSWKLFSSNEKSVCFDQPVGSVPIIVFRDSIAKNKEALIDALRGAWSTCQIGSTVPRCYVATIQKKTCNWDKFNEIYWPCIRPLPPQLSTCLNTVMTEYQICKKKETAAKGPGKYYDLCEKKNNINARINECFDKFEDKEKKKICEDKSNDIAGCDSAR